MDKKKLIKLIEGIDDQKIIDKLFAVVAETEMKDLIEDINKKKGNSFSDNDKRIILNTVQDAPGNVQQKIEFLENCLNGGYIDMGRLLQNSNKKVSQLNLYNKYPNDPVFKYADTRLAGRNVGFNLNSGSAVGPGEGWLILVCEGVTKGRVGDLMYNGDDVELKANNARWHSARGTYQAASTSYKTAYDILKKAGMSLTYNEFTNKVDFRVGQFPSETLVKNVLKVSPSDFTNAFADGWAKVFPRGANVDYIRKTDWIGNSLKFRAAYAAALSSAYKSVDGWEYILQYDYEKKTVVTMKSGDDVYAAINNGALKATAVPDNRFLGGTDSRNISPQYAVGR